MQPKLLKTSLGAEYRPGVFSGENESGWEPIGDKVLVLTDQPADKTSGGVHLTEDFKERMSQAAETGVLVALGPGAFVWNTDRTRPFVGRRPEIGDYVYIQRYSGQTVMGRDGQLYRLMDENCIAGVRYDHKPAPVKQDREAFREKPIVLKEFDDHH